MKNEKEIEKNTITLGELVNGLVDKKLQKIKMKIDKVFDNHSQDGSEYPIKNSSIASARHPETSGVNSDFPKTLDETPEEENKKEIGK